MPSSLGTSPAIIVNWRYADLPSVVCRESTADCFTIATKEELQRVLDALSKGLVFVCRNLNPNNYD